MTKPNILISQDLPSIFEQARDEENWLIFAIGKPDAKGKRAKRPVVSDKPYIWTDRAKAAVFTLDKALKRMQDFATMFGSVEDINAKAKARRDKMIADGKKPGPEIEVEGYALGYFAREDSALVALDFDNVVEGGVVLDFELAGLIDATSAYAEISSSGTGLRVFMPRVWGDEAYHGGERNDVGLFVSSKGAGCALTFNVVADGAERDQALFDLVLERHGAVTDRKREDAGDIADQVLEYGLRPPEEFRELVAHVKNDSRFDEFGAWQAMIRSAREYYEVTYPDRLDEVYQIVSDWCETWSGGNHDPDALEELWERPARGNDRAGLGGWVKLARESGWCFPDERPVELPEWAEMPRPKALLETVEDFTDRIVLINGEWFDRWHNAPIRSVEQFGNLISQLPWKKPKTAKTMTASIRYDQARRHAHRFTGAAFMPGEPDIVRDKRPTQSGKFEDAPGAVLYNLWSAIEVDPEAEVPQPWLDHVRRIYPQDAETLIDWLAFVVQNPGKKVGWAPILIGPQGCGKDTITAPIINAMGRFAQGNLGIDAMDQTHNGWLETALLLVMQESVTGRMTKANVTEKLKTLIAAPPDTLPLRKMQRDIVQVPNVLNVLFLTNHLDTVYMEDAERRFWPIMTDEVPEEAHFEALWNWLNGGGDRAVLSYLMQRRTRIKERRRAPDSDVKRAVIESNMPEGSEEVLSYVSGKAWVSTKHIKNTLGTAVEFGGVQGWRMSDRNLNAALVHAGFRKLDRMVIRTETGLEGHTVYVRRKGVTPSQVRHDAIYEALIAGGDEITKSQRCYTLKGVTGGKGETDKIL